MRLGLTRYIRAFFINLREFGLSFTLKLALEYLGIKTYIKAQYPIVDIKVRVRTANFWKELERGQSELNAIKYLAGTVREGQVIIDAGAWVGPYTLLFSKLVKEQGRIYAFDPDPVALAILRHNVAANHLANVRIEPVCLSNSTGKTRLKSFSKTGRFGGSDSTIISPLQKEVTREITVETTTIDKYCEENNIRPHGIKIDVEGAEGLVIEGGRSIIQKCSPWVLLEFHGHLMPEEERRRCWQKIVADAKKVVFVEGDSNQYHNGDEIDSIPDCLKFRVFIHY